MPHTRPALTLNHACVHRMRLRKREKASQLSNMRSPMRKKVTFSKRPARALRPKALSVMRSKA